MSNKRLSLLVFALVLATQGKPARADSGIDQLKEVFGKVQSFFAERAAARRDGREREFQALSALAPRIKVLIERTGELVKLYSEDPIARTMPPSSFSGDPAKAPERLARLIEDPSGPKWGYGSGRTGLNGAYNPGAGFGLDHGDPGGPLVAALDLCPNDHDRFVDYDTDPGAYQKRVQFKLTKARDAVEGLISRIEESETTPEQSRWKEGSLPQMRQYLASIDEVLAAAGGEFR